MNPIHDRHKARRGHRHRGRRASGPTVRHLGAPSFLASIVPEGYPIGLSSFGFNFAAGVSPANGSLAVLCIANSLTLTPTGGNGVVSAGGLTWSTLGTIPTGQANYRMEVFAAIAAGGALSGTFTRPTGGGNFQDVHISLFEFPNYGGPINTEDITVDIRGTAAVPYSEAFTARTGDYTLSCASIVAPDPSPQTPTGVGVGWSELHTIAETANGLETWIAGRGGALSTVDWAALNPTDGMCVTTVSIKLPNT